MWILALASFKPWKETVSVYFDASILVSCESCDYVKDHVSIHVTCFHFKIAVVNFASTSSNIFYLLVHWMESKLSDRTESYDSEVQRPWFVFLMGFTPVSLRSSSLHVRYRITEFATYHNPVRYLYLVKKLKACVGEVMVPFTRHNLV